MDTHIAELRRKLEEEPAEPRYIPTGWKAGYRSNGSTAADCLRTNAPAARPRGRSLQLRPLRAGGTAAKRRYEAPHGTGRSRARHSFRGIGNAGATTKLGCGEGS